MKRTSFTSLLNLLALAGAVLLWPQVVQPQTPPAPTNSVPSLPVPEEPRITLNIKSGLLNVGDFQPPRSATVEQVVRILQSQAPDADFVLSPGTGGIVISNLTLRAANLKGALDAISYATDTKVRASKLGNANIYALAGYPGSRPEKSLEVFNLSAMLDSLGARDSDAVRKRIEEISTLVAQTITDFDQRTQQQRGTPLLNFHGGTGLLVVIGHPEQLEIASKIIQALHAPVGASAPGPTPKVPATPQSKSSPDQRATTP